MTPAQKIKSKIREYCKKNGYIFINIISCSVAGIPDLCVITFEKVYFFEVKSKNDTLKPLQKVTIQEINETKPNTAFVVGSLEDVVEILGE